MPLAFASAWGHVAVATRPNILLAIADDLGWADLGVNGSREHSMPPLDSLATGGVHEECLAQRAVPWGEGRRVRGCIRVPFVFQWKGGPPLPGVPIEGVNLLPHLRGGIQAPPHDTLFCGWRSSKAVRQGDWKWLVATGRATEALFDLARDPAEQHDHAAREPDRVRSMAAASAVCDAKNPPLDPRHFIHEGGPKAR